MKARDYIPALYEDIKIYPQSLAYPMGMQYIHKIWYVDGTNGSDNYSGESEEEAFATIQKAMDSVSSYDWIQVLPGSYSENLTTPLAGGARSVTLSGFYNGFRAENRTTIIAADGAVPIIDVRVQGWRITGFRICVASTSCGIRLRHTDVAEATGSSVSPYTTIDNNLFYANLYGIEIDGAPHSCQIINNEFLSNTDGIRLVSSGIKALGNWVVRDNFFNGNTNHLNVYGGTWGSSVITDNYFRAGATRYLWMQNSVNNCVTRNVFAGTYSQAGGYNGGNATNIWTGNYGAAAITTGRP